MEEEEGRGAEATSSLNGERYHGSGGERSRGVDAGIVLALVPFALGGGSVSCQMGKGGRLLLGGHAVVSGKTESAELARQLAPCAEVVGGCCL